MDSDRSTLSGNSPRTKVHISRSGSIAIRNDGPPSPTRMSPQKSPSKKNIAGLKDAVNSLRIKAIRQYRTNESSKIVAADLGGATDQGIDTIEPSTPSTPSLSQNDVEKIAKFAARVSPDASIQPFTDGTFQNVMDTKSAVECIENHGNCKMMYPVLNTRHEVVGIFMVEYEGTERDRMSKNAKICPAIASVLASGIEHQGQVDNTQMLSEQLHEATLTEQKMASIITWLFEVIGSGDGQEHKAEIQEMRDTFIRAHYGVGGSTGSNMEYAPGESASNVIPYKAVETDEEAFVTHDSHNMELKDLEGAGEKDYVLEAGNTRPVGAEVYVSRRGSITIHHHRQTKADGHAKDVSIENDDRWEKAFAAADKNSDGTISAVEFKKWFLEQQERKDRQDSALV